MNKIVVLILFVTMSLMSGCGLFSKSENLQERVEQYYTAVNTGDAKKMETFYSSTAKDSDKSINNRLRFYQQGYKYKIIFVDSEIKPEPYTIAEPTNGRAEYQDIHIWKKENNNWYIVE